MINMIYIAGPMTGMPQHNFPYFRRVEQRLLQAEDTIVVNPVNIIEAAGGWEKLERDERKQADVIREELVTLAMCNRIHLLPGWQNSKGTRKELQIALLLGMEITEDHVG